MCRGTPSFCHTCSWHQQPSSPNFIWFRRVKRSTLFSVLGADSEGRCSLPLLPQSSGSDGSGDIDSCTRRGNAGDEPDLPHLTQGRLKPSRAGPWPDRLQRRWEQVVPGRILHRHRQGPLAGGSSPRTLVPSPPSTGIDGSSGLREWGLQRGRPACGPQGGTEEPLTAGSGRVARLQGLRHADTAVHDHRKFLE